jgi:ribosomal protein S18 acetylase RimI-like enzyme
VQIRTFTDADTEAVVALWRQAGLTRPWNDPHRDIGRKQLAGAELFFVAEDSVAEEDGAVVGVIMAGYDGHRGWLNYLAVAESHRGTGLGRALVERAEMELLALGCPKVHLQVRPDNDAVVAFYARLGYEAYEVIDMGKRLVTDEA